MDQFLRSQEDNNKNVIDYGAVPFPVGETGCLKRGQKLTDRTMDYLATLLFRLLGCDETRLHIIPSLCRGNPVDWTRYHRYEKVLMIMHQAQHWFLLVAEPSRRRFHLYDTLASEDDSPIDVEDLSIGDNDVMEDYYGKIPDQQNQLWRADPPQRGPRLVGEAPSRLPTMPDRRG